MDFIYSPEYAKTGEGFFLGDIGKREDLKLLIRKTGILDAPKEKVQDAGIELPLQITGSMRKSLQHTWGTDPSYVKTALSHVLLYFDQNLQCAQWARHATSTILPVGRIF